MFSHSNNRIGTDGAIVLSKVLPINDTLKELKVCVILRPRHRLLPRIAGIARGYKLCSFPGLIMYREHLYLRIMISYAYMHQKAELNPRNLF